MIPTDIMAILIIVALIGITINLFLVTNPTDDGVRGPATTAVWGYGAIAMSTLGLMLTMMGDKNKTKGFPEQRLFKFSAELLTTSIPSLCLLAVLVAIIMLNGNYYNKINKGEVPKDYYKYSTLSTMTISAQYFLLIYYISNELQDDNKSFSKAISYIIYLFTLGNIIMIGIMTAVLKYFTTDG